MKGLLVAIVLALLGVIGGCVPRNNGLPRYLKIYSSGSSCYLNPDWRGHVPPIDRIDGDRISLWISYAEPDHERDTTVASTDDAIVDTVISVGVNKAFPCELQWVTIEKTGKGYKITGRRNDTGHKRQIEIYSMEPKHSESNVIIIQK